MKREVEEEKEKLSVHIKSIIRNYCISNGLTPIILISLLPPKIEEKN